MRIKYLHLLLALLIVGTYSCSNKNEQPTEPPLDPNLGKSYFFLEEGKYREYDVVETFYTAVDFDTTFNYQIREEVKEAINTTQGEKAHIVHRFSRSDENAEWKLDSVWSARVESRFAVANENNVPLIKFAFPADTLQTWDRNLYNGRLQEIVRMRTFNQPYTVGFNTFLNASEIEISLEDDSLTRRDNRFEVFSDSIGLVYKYSEVLKYCSDEDRCEIGGLVIESGRFYTETLIAHGNVNDPTVEEGDGG